MTDLDLDALAALVPIAQRIVRRKGGAVDQVLNALPDLIAAAREHADCWAVKASAEAAGSMLLDVQQDSIQAVQERDAARADERKRLADLATEALESLDLLCRAEDIHGDTIRAHEVRDAVADLRAALAQPADTEGAGA